jgi:pyruvate formate lyase activating enzyme
MDRLMDQASPERIAQVAREMGCASVAFTYNDPVIFAEYALDTADACHALGVRTVAVTAGYIHAEPRRRFFASMDAANVDLKGFTEDFYFRQTGAHLAPVLDTLQHIVHESGCWLEITTLLIPELNDSDAELQAMTRWVAEHLGRDVPMHFTAFHPDYKMTDLPRTPAATLTRARRIAHDAGLRYVYTGNVHDTEGGTTSCPGCGVALIERDWHEILRYELDDQGRCTHCGTALPGRFAAFERSRGRRRVPVRVAMG